VDVEEVVFVGRGISHQDHYMTLEYHNISSPYVYGGRKTQIFNNSRVDVLLGSSENLQMTNVSVKVLSHHANSVLMENVRIDRIERFRGVKQAIITNSHFENFNSSAFIACKNSSIHLVNVTIGRIDRESLIFLGRYSLFNVTIEHAVEESLILDGMEFSKMVRVEFKSGSSRPIQFLSLNSISTTNIVIKGVNYIATDDTAFAKKYASVQLLLSKKHLEETKQVKLTRMDRPKMKVTSKVLLSFIVIFLALFFSMCLGSIIYSTNWKMIR